MVLDSTDARASAEFYRALFDLHYRPGDEPPAEGTQDVRGRDWLVLRDSVGVGLAFQQVEVLHRSTWPDDAVPQQLHLDTTVSDRAELDAVHDRALALGAQLRLDRSDDDQEPLRVYADPDGHTFCVFVATG